MNKKILLMFFLLYLVSTGPGLAQNYSQTKQILSNDIYLLEGSSDTLWMLTSKGINYTTRLTEKNVDKWIGFKGLLGWDINYGNGYTLIRVTENYDSYFKSGSIDKLWLFNIRNKNQRFITLPFDVDSLDFTAVFQAADAVWFKDAFWIACMNGGLVRLNVLDNSMRIFYPGHDSVSYSSSAFMKDSSFKFNDSAFAIDVDAGGTFIWLACKTALWSFNPVDTTWKKINPPMPTVKEYIDIKVRTVNDTAVVYSMVSGIGARNDTLIYLYAYRNSTGCWHRVIGDADSASAMFMFTLGTDDLVYVCKSDKISLYKGAVPDTTVNTHTPFAKTVASLDFTYRIINASDEDIEFSINDINYTINGRDTIFQIATDKGLLFSSDEHKDEKDDTPFRYEFRKISVSSGLEQTYAVPGIINRVHPKTVFVYNLSKGDEVTIDIFDYNMDHVLSILDTPEYREKGSQKTSGRSTDPARDCWDGTVDGRPVPPGVYYYRIKTKNGRKRIFGKVIVAKN